MNRIILPAPFLKSLWDYYNRQCSLNNIGRRGMTTYYQSQGYDLQFTWQSLLYSLPANEYVFMLIAYGE
jgi:hypothetical protein